LTKKGTVHSLTLEEKEEEKKSVGLHGDPHGDGDRGKYSPVMGIRDGDGERIHWWSGDRGSIPAPDPPH